MATPTQEQLSDLSATYAKGVTLATLANQFGVSIPTVAKWVVKGGGVIRPRGQRKKTTFTLAPVEMTNTVETFEPREAFVEPDVDVSPRQIFQSEV